MKSNSTILTAFVLSVGLTVAGCESPLEPSVEADAPVVAKATTTTANIVVPFAQANFVTCANGGAGEIVVLSGNLHVLIHLTISDNGSFTLKRHVQPQGATAIGLITNDTYHATGVTQSTWNIQGDGLPISFTEVNNFRIIGPGPDNNLLVHQVIHITIGNDGVVRVVNIDTSVECR